MSAARTLASAGGFLLGNLGSSRCSVPEVLSASRRTLVRRPCVCGGRHAERQQRAAAGPSQSLSMMNTCDASVSETSWQETLSQALARAANSARFCSGVVEKWRARQDSNLWPLPSGASTPNRTNSAPRAESSLPEPWSNRRPAEQEAAVCRNQGAGSRN